MLIIKIIKVAKRFEELIIHLNRLLRAGSELSVQVHQFLYLINYDHSILISHINKENTIRLLLKNDKITNQLSLSTYTKSPLW